MSLEQIDLGFVAVAGGVLVLGLLLLLRWWRRSRESSDYLDKVRRLVERGDFRRAGQLQLRHSNLQEAFNLFERGDVHDLASEAAERLGYADRAAMHAERAGLLERAAGLYERCQEYAGAARLYHRVGNFRLAAEALERDLKAPSIELAQLWENAFLDAVPSEGEPIAPAQLQALTRAAERAAEAYKRAGELERAAHFFELSEHDDVANRIRANLPARAMDKLDQVRDRLRGRLSSASANLALEDRPARPAPTTELSHRPQPVAESHPPAKTALGMPTRGPVTAMAPPGAMVADVANAPTTMLDRAALGASPDDPVRSPDGLPPEVADAQLFRPASDGGRDEVFDLPVPDLRPGDSVFDSPSMQSVLDPLETSSVYAAVRDDETPLPPPVAEELRLGAQAHSPSDDVVATGGRQPLLTPPTSQDAIRRDAATPEPSPGWFGVPSTLGADAKPARAHQEVVHRAKASLPPRAAQGDGGRYSLGEQLGEGTLGIVCRAHDAELDRDVALKFLPEDIGRNEILLSLFEQQVKGAAALSHPNIVAVHDHGLIGGRPFVAMEIVEGETVAELIERRYRDGLPVLDVLRIAEGLLSALDYAHKRQLVHRQVSPSNVMRTAAGRVLVTDFGLGKLADSDSSQGSIGSRAHLAPEQRRGEGVDHRSDIFALGVTIYEMLTGKRPFDERHSDTPVRPPRMLAPGVPKRLDKLVVECLSFRPDDRPQSTEQLLRAVENMRRQVEIYLDRELDDVGADGVPSSVEAIDADTLRTLLSQLSAPGAGDAAEAEPLFRAALVDRRAGVRASAVELYPAVLDEQLDEAVASLLSDESEEVRVAVIDRIGSTGRIDMLDALAQRADESQGLHLSSNERRAIYNSLIELAGPRAIEIFQALFESTASRNLPAAEEDQRHLRAELKDLLDALTRYEEADAHRLADQIIARKRQLDERAPQLTTPATGQPVARNPDDSARRRSRRKAASDSGRSSREDLPQDVRALLLDYLKE